MMKIFYFFFRNTNRQAADNYAHFYKCKLKRYNLTKWNLGIYKILSPTKYSTEYFVPCILLGCNINSFCFYICYNIIRNTYNYGRTRTNFLLQSNIQGGADFSVKCHYIVTSYKHRTLAALLKSYLKKYRKSEVLRYKVSEIFTCGSSQKVT